MSDVTQILSQVEAGVPLAAEELLPLVYEELRKLAEVRMKDEPPAHTLQATALVHEAYMRLVVALQSWDNLAVIFLPPPQVRCGRFWLTRRVPSRGTIGVAASSGGLGTVIAGGSTRPGNDPVSLNQVL